MFRAIFFVATAGVVVGRRRSNLFVHINYIGVANSIKHTRAIDREAATTNRISTPFVHLIFHDTAVLQFFLQNDNHDEKMRFVQRGFYTHSRAAYCSYCPTAQLR